MMRRPFVTPALGLAAALALSGCGSSPPTVLLTLDAAPPAPQAVRADYRGLPIAVPAVHIPASLDRAELVAQPGAGTVEVDDFARWSAPVAILARDALVRDLVARLPEGSVLPPGATGRAGKTVTIDVTILSLATLAPQATMQAAYRCLPDGAVRQVTFNAPVSGAAPAAASRAFSALLGLLADRLAADVAAGGCRRIGRARA
jgi:hypothetical protein